MQAPGLTAHGVVWRLCHADTGVRAKRAAPNCRRYTCNRARTPLQPKHELPLPLDPSGPSVRFSSHRGCSTGGHCSTVSAANGDHRPVLCGGQLKHARVRGALAAHRRAYDGGQVIVAGAPAHRVTQRHLVGSKQAHLERPVRQQPQPVAVAAKVGRHGGDEGERARVARHPEVLGHLAARVLDAFQCWWLGGWCALPAARAGVRSYRPAGGQYARAALYCVPKPWDG
mmetsp:Transcript_10732/g.26446  ORF Transcript_10732/g.26446 Transcript_10732/m.26446 type:complete len:228 (+) Transcript_10732:375-1058(+)